MTNKTGRWGWSASPIASGRTHQGYDVREAASTAGMTPAQWAAIENGAVAPSHSEITAIAAVLGMGVSALLAEMRQRPVPQSAAEE